MRVPRVRFTIRGIMAIVAVIAVCLWLAGSPTDAVCDGISTYSIHVHSASQTPIRKVTCEAFSSAEAAVHTSKKPIDTEPGFWSAAAEPFVGQPLSVSLPFTFRTHRGQIVGDFQYRYLVVIVRFDDGSQGGKVVALPHRDKARTVSVEFP
jgi:hypothetical protein